jgi:hypothetical protein
MTTPRLWRDTVTGLAPAGSLPLQAARSQTPYTYLEYARFANDIVILIDAYPQHDWLLGAVEKRLREELARLHVTVNETKSRIVDLAKGESFGFPRL